MEPFIARQGDVLIVRVPTMPTGTRPVPRDDAGRVVLALGEVTGHAHAIRDPDATLYELADVDQRFLEITREVTLTHEEHGAITLAPGTYEVRRQREYVSPKRPPRLIAD
ncbi:hypothetical protein [Tenggerimyces flavus]|uniref:Uncharacterized protein n=1 Tax=Tenggerimyces flavus TaxID=1708749 RepID=A0ABV7YNS8_9ACTN|nr:hypothetical protein [Tenggerimyces flavus]MBM7784501.1 hypothetical protein [Tenggerimyces flavus]